MSRPTKTAMARFIVHASFDFIGATPSAEDQQVRTLATRNNRETILMLYKIAQRASRA